jgi:hypothetical protein
MRTTGILVLTISFLFSCNQAEKLNIEKRSGEMREYKGKPTLFINNTPTEPTIYGLTTCPGGRMSWGEMPQYSIKRFSNEAGFTLFQGELWMRDIFPNEDYELNIDLVRRQVRGFVEANPNAAVFIRLRCNSSPAWNLANREECTQWADADPTYMEEDGLHRWDDHDTETSLRYSLASKKWREDMVKKIEILCRELEKTPEGNAVVGIQMATGIYGENHYWGFLFNEPDVSQPMQEHFKEWLKEKYKTDEALQKAWNNEKATMETAEVPKMENRFPEDPHGIFRDPETNRNMIDYTRCQHELVVDNVLLFCKTAKETWNRPLITGAFYGYYFYCFGRHATGGHLAMERMLTSPYIDYLCAPQTYGIYSKMMGGSGHARGIVEACNLHGKIWLDEFDNSSSLHPENMKEYLSDFTDNLEEDKAMIRRNLASAYTRGGGRWFYDFGPRTIGGWWNDSVLLKDIAQIKDIFEHYMHKDFEQEADVLVVYDTEVYYYLAQNWHIDVITHTGVEWATTDLFQSGVAFEQCLLFDLDKMNLDKYKAVLFVNTFKMTEYQREFVKEKVAANGRTLIWNYMPGYCNGKELNEGFIKELVNIEIQQTKIMQPPPIIEWQSDKSQQYGLTNKFAAFFPFEKLAEADKIWNHEPAIYEVTDPQAKPLAMFKGSAKVAIARKEEKGWTSVYCALPLQNENIMREIFREAGCHIYDNEGDVIHSGGGIMAIHTAQAGTKTIALQNGKTVQVEMPANHTTLLDNETGEVLLE